MTTTNHSRADALPAAPVRPEYDADAVRFGECDFCNKRSHIRPRDGAMICGSCADADYLTAWINHAEQLRAMLAARSVEQHEAAPAENPTREWLLGDALASCLQIITENRKRIGYEPGSPNHKTVIAARKLLEDAPSAPLEGGNHA